MQVLYPDQIGFGGLVFVEGRKLENPEKNPRSKARTNNKLNAHMTPGRNPTRARLVGDERSHHCAIPAPQCVDAFCSLHLGVLSHSLRILRSQYCVSSKAGPGCDSSAQGHGTLGPRTKRHGLL